MINLSYTLSPQSMIHIEKIELLRSQILLAPLSEKTERKLKFETKISKIYWSVNLSGNTLTKSEIEKMIINSFPFMPPSRKKSINSPEARMVLRYKNALDYLKESWYVTSSSVRSTDILTLASLIETKKLKNEPTDLSTLPAYLDKSSEHPVIQAAIAHIQIILMAPFLDGNGRLARLLGLLYLYKYGYDFRGMLVLDEYWRRDLASLEVIKETVLRSKSLNVWLDYYMQGMITQLEKSLVQIQTQGFKPERRGNDYYNLNDRQKLIINVADFPQATITNRKVQKHFNISQITASRDLAKLANLGLLTARGKGRSVYYTRG